MPDADDANDTTTVAEDNGQGSKLGAALAYARAGLPVFPCRGKLPCIKDWPNQATTDEAQVRAWFDVKPAPNIGIVTGSRSGLWVVDVDGEEGEASWHDLIAANGGWGAMPDVLSVKTAKGWHYWFRWPDGGGIRNSAGALGEGVDVRGDGGFVIAPPSRGYRFEDIPDEGES